MLSLVDDRFVDSLINFSKLAGCEEAILKTSQTNTGKTIVAYDEGCEEIYEYILMLVKTGYAS